MKQTTLAAYTTAPDGIIHTDKAVLLYSRYNPEAYPNRPHTYKVGPVGRTGRINWSRPLALNLGGAFEVGNRYAIMERGGSHRYLVTLGPRMRMDHGLSIGVGAFPDGPRWVVRTHFTQPYPVSVYFGPRGGYGISPDTGEAPILRGGDLDPPRLYTSRVLLCDDPTDRVTVRRGADGELYALNHSVLGGTYCFFRFPVGCLPGREGYAIWGGCSLPGVAGYEEILDFDVSPDGRTLAVALIVKTDDAGDRRVYRRQLWLYETTPHDTRLGLTLRTKYEWPCQFVSYSPDGLTLALVGNDNWLRAGYMETLTVVDID